MAAASMMLSAISCSNDGNDAQSGQSVSDVSLTASREGSEDDAAKVAAADESAGTRVSRNNRVLTWDCTDTNKDEIRVFSGATSSKFKASSANGRKARFKLQTDHDGLGDNYDYAANALSAAYPYSAASVTASALTMTYDGKTYCMVGTKSADSNEIQFLNAFNVLRFSGDDIDATATLTADCAIKGDITVGADGFATTTDLPSDNTITLSNTETVDGTTYYFAVIPAYNRAITFMLTGKDSKKHIITLKSTTDNGVIKGKRNKVYSLTTSDMKDGELVPSVFTKLNYYQWDAYSSYVSGNYGNDYFGDGKEGYNTDVGDVNDCGNNASHSCKNCPTAKEMYAYLLAGAYFDYGTAIQLADETYSYPPAYTLAGTKYNNYDHSTHALASGKSGYGLWLPKNAYIKANNKLKSQSGCSESNSGVEKYNGTIPEAKVNLASSDNLNITALTSSNAKEVRESGNYFYLPAAGYYYSVSGHLIHNGEGAYGYYWSSSAAGSGNAYVLRFLYSTEEKGIDVRIFNSLSYGNFRSSGFIPLSLQ